MNRMRYTSWIFGVAIVANFVALCFSAVPVAKAATFVVTKTDDTADGACDGDCSLREAIIAANADPNPDTITLGAGTYILSLPGTYENAAATGDLDITTDVTLLGAGAEQTILDGSGFPADDKDGIFHILPAMQGVTPTVTIADVTVQNARPFVGARSAGIYVEYANLTVRASKVISNVSNYFLSGGGIYVIFGKLTLEDSLVAHNQSQAGGGISSLASPITITNSIIEHNRADGQDNPAPGGGIAFYSGALVIKQSKIRNNIATRTKMDGGCGASDGGGIFISNTGLAETTLQLLDSEVSNNTANTDVASCSIPSGGGLYVGNIKALLIQNSTILSNTAGIAGGLYDLTNESSRIVNSNISYNRAIQPPEVNTINGIAGGICAAFKTEVISSTISHNSAASDGGGIFGNAFTVRHSIVAYNTAGGYGGGIAGAPYVTDSSIHHNSANHGGGVVFILGGSVERSALYENVATRDGGGIYLLYGGRDQLGRTVTTRVFNSTVSGNRAKNGGAFSNSGAAMTTSGLPGSAHTLFRNTTLFGNSATNSGGGLHHHACCEIEIENSVVASNGAAGDCGGAVNAGGFVSLGHNLAGDITCSIFVATGDVNNTNPLLGPLQNNGGGTPTHEPLSNSPAVDSGNNTTCLATDQRGVLRPQGFVCDKGAFEFVPDTPILYVSPQELHYAAQLGSNQPLTRSFEIRNAGGGALNWTLSETMPWLILSSSSGKNDAVVVATVTGNGLSAGTYTGTITVQAPGVGGSPQTIHTLLSINREATGIITPVGGGTIQTSDGSLKLTFPPAAVGGITTVTATLTSSPDHPLQMSCGNQEICSYAGVAAQLLATNGDGEMVTLFNQPYLLVLSYDPAVLTAKGIEEGSLQWWRWTGDQWTKASCECNVDAANDKFTVQASNFSEYALFGVQANPTYALTVNKTGNGEVTLQPPGGSYTPGTVVKLTATPASGFTFGAWSGAVSGVANPVAITMSSDKTVTANFTAIPVNFALTVNTNGNGSVALNPPGGTYNAGTIVQLTAAPVSGFTFASWSGAIGGNNNPISLTIDSNKTVVATFLSLTAPQHTLTVSQIGGGTVTLDPPGGVYAEGTIVTVTAVPAADSIFLNWNGSISGSTNPIQVTVDGEKSVIANFAVSQKNYLPIVQR